MSKKFKLVIFIMALIIVSVPSTKKVLKDRKNADQFVVYCEEYKQKYGQYPEKMEDMVPEFFDTDQLAKFGYDASGPSHFLHYKAYGDGKRSLWYMTGVPFHTNNYRFEEKKWLHYGT